jgi:hypothetical protein
VVTQAGRSPWVDFDANGGGPLDFDVLEQTLVIQLRDRAGRPLRGEQVIETSLGKKVTDAEGRLTWAPFGFQPVHLVFRPAGVGRGPGTEPQRLGPFAPKSGQRTTTLEVRVPD